MGSGEVLPSVPHVLSLLDFLSCDIFRERRYKSHRDDTCRSSTERCRGKTVRDLIKLLIQKVPIRSRSAVIDGLLQIVKLALKIGSRTVSRYRSSLVESFMLHA